jgi:hypothetical protein
VFTALSFNSHSSVHDLIVCLSNSWVSCHWPVTLFRSCSSCHPGRHFDSYNSCDRPYRCESPSPMYTSTYSTTLRRYPVCFCLFIMLGHFRIVPLLRFVAASHRLYTCSAPHPASASLLSREHSCNARLLLEPYLMLAGGSMLGTYSRAT